VPGEAGLCAGGTGAGNGGRQPAAVAANRGCAAESDARCVDPPKRLDRLSGSGKPAVSEAQTDAVLCGEFQKAAAMLQVLGQQPGRGLLRQTSIGMAMDWSMRSGLVSDTSSRSGLSSPCQVKNLLRKTTRFFKYR
jgi:hypothetical protein